MLRYSPTVVMNQEQRMHQQRRLRDSFGSAGLLVPDIPLEETGPVREVATAAGLELVLLTTPTTPLPRMEAIAKVSQGFVYLVSVTGTPLLLWALPLQVWAP